MSTENFKQVYEQMIQMNQLTYNSGQMLQVTNGVPVWTTPTSHNSYNFTAASNPVQHTFLSNQLAAASLITIYKGNETLVEIRPDGTLTYGDNYAPDTAAQTFWEALSTHTPTVQYQNHIKELEAQVAALTPASKTDSLPQTAQEIEAAYKRAMGSL